MSNKTKIIIGVLCITALLSFTFIKVKTNKETKNKWVPVSAMEVDKTTQRKIKRLLK